MASLAEIEGQTLTVFSRGELGLQYSQGTQETFFHRGHPNSGPDLHMAVHPSVQDILVQLRERGSECANPISTRGV